MDSAQFSSRGRSCSSNSHCAPGSLVTVAPSPRCQVAQACSLPHIYITNLYTALCTIYLGRRQWI